MRSIFLFFLILAFYQAVSQINTSSGSAMKEIDSLYREDQFYFGITINMLQRKLVALNQSKISTGFSTGFLRDFPINRNRTIAVAPGLGIALNNYSQNLLIAENNSVFDYSLFSASSKVSKNKFSQLLVEFPIELRWRSSTFESHKFWRIYTGFKLGYLVYNRSVYKDDVQKIVVTRNKDFNKFQYGTYISVGYNSLNLYASYGLNALFKSAKIENESIQIRPLNFGIMFYIL